MPIVPSTSPPENVIRKNVTFDPLSLLVAWRSVIALQPNMLAPISSPDEQDPPRENGNFRLVRLHTKKAPILALSQQTEQKSSVWRSDQPPTREEEVASDEEIAPNTFQIAPIGRHQIGMGQK
ncbi:unnamed protein product [Protopolystoma xenopodis]|uniref:Uncharacterized protein n=1 Tax=Protopolystoma xenopodis TaxID=117903 RepID=A0A448WLP7_9PLAT|nr:unnamed protein product [Protopolystoma xenopodis]